MTFFEFTKKFPNENECNFVRLKIDHTIENFWSIVKRGVYGIFHNVSMKYLQNYVDEFCFRLNYRDYDIAFEKIVELAVA